MKIYVKFSPNCVKDFSYRKAIIEHICVTIRMLRNRLHDNTEKFFADNGNEKNMFDDIFPRFYQAYRQTISIYNDNHYNLVAQAFTLLYEWEREDLKNLFNGVSYPVSFDFDICDIVINGMGTQDYAEEDFKYIGTYDTTKDDMNSLKLDGEPLH